MISAGQHVSIFGMTGCGKSTLTREISHFFERKIIFDRLNEWTHDNYPVATNLDEFVSLYRQCHTLDSFAIIIRPRAGLDSETLVDLANSILGLIYQIESQPQSQKGIALIFEEVWLYAPLHSCPQWLTEIALTGRHYNISFIANSQRPAHVSKTLVTQSRHVFIGQFFEMNDRKYLRETLGDLPQLNTPPKPGEFIWFRPAFPESTQIIKIF